MKRLPIPLTTQYVMRIAVDLQASGRVELPTDTPQKDRDRLYNFVRRRGWLWSFNVTDRGVMISK